MTYNRVTDPGQTVSTGAIPRIAILNRYTALGIPVTRSVGEPRQGKGKLALQALHETEPDSMASCWN